MSDDFLIDVLAGEQVLAVEEVLGPADPALNPSFRPPVSQALKLLLGKSGDYTVPFASTSFSHHSDVVEQNLFRCLFGRDSLIIASFLAHSKPEMLVSVLCALAEHQGEEPDASSEEESGRIPHEVRQPNDPQLKRLEKESGWKFPYYGSVDATLLWLKAVGQVAERDRDFLNLVIRGKTISQRAELATAWILERLSQGGGLIRSARSNPNGILNQVWKDSGDSYLTQSGRVAKSSGTASVETIGETYDALLAASKLIHLDERNWILTPGEILNAADELQNKLLGQWWLGDRFAMAEGVIDGQMQKLDGIASNQWRLLDSSVLSDRESLILNQLAQSVTDAEIFGPTGIRTLGKSNPRFRPGGYHTGSSWPFDSALIVRGLLRHGFRREAHELVIRTRAAIEGVGGYPELLRSDATGFAAITRHVIDVWDPETESTNRVCQPPQLIQGWTVAAYSWLRELKL